MYLLHTLSCLILACRQRDQGSGGGGGGNKVLRSAVGSLMRSKEAITSTATHSAANQWPDAALS